MTSEDRLNRIARDLDGTELCVGAHGGTYRIGTAENSRNGRADFHAISTTGRGFQTSELRAAEAFARGVRTGSRPYRDAANLRTDLDGAPFHPGAEEVWETEYAGESIRHRFTEVRDCNGDPVAYALTGDVAAAISERLNESEGRPLD